jgi:DNA-binding beta-propeller fold protein YncE
MKTIMLLILMYLFFQSVHSQDNKIFQNSRLEKKWETAAVFNIPESVCYDPASGIIYVSNVGGKPSEKDGNGYIAVLSVDGTVSKGRIISGLNAPKGMGIYINKLYVSDIDRVAEIDLQSFAISRFYEFPDARFLNDIAIGPDGAVYISDMSSARIFRILNGKSETWLDDPLLINPNGLFVQGDALLIGCGKIVSAGLEDKKLSVVIPETGGIDGLIATGKGEYLYSDWTGNVFLAAEGKKTEKLLDTSPAGINAADIDYVPSLNLLLVPTFSDNRVMAYELE